MTIICVVNLIENKKVIKKYKIKNIKYFIIKLIYYINQYFINNYKK